MDSVDALVTPKIAAVVALAAARPEFNWLRPRSEEHRVEIGVALIIDVVEPGLGDGVESRVRLIGYGVRLESVDDLSLIARCGLHGSDIENRAYPGSKSGVEAARHEQRKCRKQRRQQTIVRKSGYRRVSDHFS